MSDVDVKKTQPEADKSPVELRRAAYNKAVREATLIAILLTSVNFGVERGNDVGASKKRSYGGTLSNFAFDNDTKRCVARIQWSVTLKAGRKNMSKCVVTYDVIYGGFTTSDEEVVRLFADNVARPATYSYFRALYANLAWSADLGVSPLPVIKFTPRV